MMHGSWAAAVRYEAARTPIGNKAPNTNQRINERATTKVDSVKGHLTSGTRRANYCLCVVEELQWLTNNRSLDFRFSTGIPVEFRLAGLPGRSQGDPRDFQSFIQLRPLDTVMLRQ